MAAYFNLTLDTTAPSGGSISFAVGITNTRTVTATLGATGAAQMKLYGDIGTGATPTAEGDASWETYSTSKSVQLTSGDGTKTVYAKFRDAVGNASAAASTTIALDTSAAAVTITGPDVSTVSKVAGYNVSEFSFSADAAFVEYKVKVVPSTSSSHDVGTQIPTTAGSTNMSGTGTYPASTPITCTVNAADLETASAGDGLKIVKVFVKDSAGNWSV
jgi:hypothetical protein